MFVHIYGPPPRHTLTYLANPPGDCVDGRRDWSQCRFHFKDNEQRRQGWCVEVLDRHVVLLKIQFGRGPNNACCSHQRPRAPFPHIYPIYGTPPRRCSQRLLTHPSR